MADIPKDIGPIDELPWADLVLRVDDRILRELLGRLHRAALAQMAWSINAQTGLGHRDYTALLEILDGQRS